jgi:outer membrane lipoprotein-sorting protein
MGDVQSNARATLAVTALMLAACGPTQNQAAKLPTASEILNKPDQASVKDAHFTLVAHIVSAGVAFDATGDGVIVIKPTQGSKFTMMTTIAGQSLKFEEIIIDGKEYDLAPDNPRWTVKASTSSNPSSFKGTDAVYLGENALAQGKAWHVKAKDASGSPFEAWVRESDGYPLKYATTTQGSSFTATFDHFNTGQTVTAPPSSDVQQ